MLWQTNVFLLNHNQTTGTYFVWQLPSGLAKWRKKEMPLIWPIAMEKKAAEGQVDLSSSLAVAVCYKRCLRAAW